ncbi:MAG: type II toxin-antitoxin system MqsA family antitoxin [Oligoflexales bacterium]|nr:type II toxin-antitoxin system MqsA family antitoxin [Oligoflexales bacterium]
MNCPACKSKMAEGFTELVFRRDRCVIVIEHVPALVCSQCGEASMESPTAQQAYMMAEQEINRGVSLEFCKFRAA